MTLPTREDIEKCIKLMGQEEFQIGVSDAMKIGERLKGLLAFYDKSGLPVGEVDIYLLGEVPGRKQLTQIHSFAVGDRYTLLPEDDDPEDAVDDWKIQDIRAHVSADNEQGNNKEAE